MLVSYHFPLFDARPLVEAEPSAPRQASWPKPISSFEGLFGVKKPETGAPFQHFLGPIMLRTAGGVDGWIGEACHCDVTAVRIAGKRGDAGRDALPVPYTLRPIFRRFFFDGTCVGKLDIGFHLRAEPPLYESDRYLPRLFRSINKLSVHCKHITGHELTFADMADLLRALYSKSVSLDDEAAGIMVGAPLRLVAVRPRELGALTEKEFIAGYVDRRSSRFRWSIFDGGSIAYTQQIDGTPTFFLFPSDKYTAEQSMRRCRIAFSRIFSEVFCFYGLSRTLEADAVDTSDDEAQQRLLARLNTVMVRLTGRDRTSNDTDQEFYRFVIGSFFGAFNPGIIEEIVREVRRHGGRSNLTRAIENLSALPGDFVPGAQPTVIIRGDFVVNKQTGIEISGGQNDFSGAKIDITQTLQSVPGEKITGELDKLIAETKQDAPDDVQHLEEAKKKVEAKDEEGWQQALMRVSMSTLSKATALGLPIIAAVVKKQLGL